MRIALLGDTAFYGKFSLNNPEILDDLKPIAGLLNKYDYVVLNLETPFIKNDSKTFGSKSAYIGAFEENVQLLMYLGVSAVNLANNHIFDFGSEAYKNTLKILEKNNISYFGTEGKQWLIEDEHNKIAFHGYCCYSTNPVGVGKEGVNVLNVETVGENMIENDKKGYFNIVSIHAGQEHVNTPNYDNILMSRKWAELVPYIYYGHHPHVLQGIEKHHDSLIAYSLGNFCFDDVYTSKSKEPLISMSDNNKSSMILSVEVNENRVEDYQILPIFDAKPATNSKYDEIKKNFELYSKHLTIDKIRYLSERHDDLTAYINSRKKLRNFSWFIKRLNFNSFKMILNARRNNKKYYDNVKRFLI